MRFVAFLCLTYASQGACLRVGVATGAETVLAAGQPVQLSWKMFYHHVLKGKAAGTSAAATLQALGKFTTGDAKEINSELRRFAYTPDLLANAEKVFLGMQHGRVPPEHVFRSVDMTQFKATDVGKVVPFTSFTSATKNGALVCPKTVMKMFGRQHFGECKQFLSITLDASKTGAKDIGMITPEEWHEEVLFPPFSHFEVQDFKTVDNVDYVKLREVQVRQVEPIPDDNDLSKNETSTDTGEDFVGFKTRHSAAGGR